MFVERLAEEVHGVVEERVVEVEGERLQPCLQLVEAVVEGVVRLLEMLALQLLGPEDEEPAGGV